MNKTISICIPVFNEAGNLPAAIGEVEALFKLPALSHHKLEIIITDNNSSDPTWNTIKSLSASRPHLKAYRFSRNFGYQNSIFAGLSLATGDAVIELDADLEDPPLVIPEFIAKWEQGYDVCYGVRRNRHAPLVMRMLFSCFYRLLGRCSELAIPQNSGDFRLLDRKVVDILKNLPERNLYLRGLVSYLGFKQTAVPYDRDPRRSGSSKFRMFHYMILAMDALTAFSKTPLRLISLLGLLLFAGATAVAAYYAIMTLVHGARAPGFATIVVLMLFLHSITFIFLGIIGEYLSRIFDDSKKRPRAIIADAVHDDNPPKFL
ncbi:MAG: hypothetical protein A2583_12365 [Bdellovibrionales bacterium RIFOXYD1_FULL_53_11]|nr:MAG: hypothetical protein A2583_12365 [Bdellovibrionales bacterium RIFOXYD1_FULL_53_11]